MHIFTKRFPNTAKYQLTAWALAQFNVRMFSNLPNLSCPRRAFTEEKTIFVNESFLFIFSRPGQSKELLYKRLCNSFIQ